MSLTMSLRQAPAMARIRGASARIVSSSSLYTSRTYSRQLVHYNSVRSSLEGFGEPAVAKAVAVKLSQQTAGALPNQATTTTSPAGITMPARTALPGMFAAVSQGIMSAQQLHDLIYSSLDTALAAAKMGLKVSGGAPRELGFALEAYGTELKHKASTMLQVSPSLDQKADLQGAKFLLASACMHDLSMDNYTPDLKWLSIHPAIGVPLFNQFAAGGHITSLGLPIFKPQPSQPTFNVTLQDYHILSMQRPHFIGRFLPVYWDDSMLAEAYPHPVVAIEGVAETMLTQGVLEGMMRGFPAGKMLLEAATALGLTSEASKASVMSSVGKSAAASWFDLVVSHPASLLGVLLLSRPDMPMAVFLRAAAGAEDAKRRAAKSASLLQDSAQGRAQGLGEAECDPIVCDGFEGGRVWGVGHITAVGAGDEGTGCGDGALPVGVCEPREGEEVAAVAVSKKGGRGGILRRVGGVARRMCKS